MKRRKKLWIMTAVLGLTLAVTLGVMLMDEKMETIRESGETVLAIPVDSVTALSWDYEGETLSFTKEEDWNYDEDRAFPVSAWDMENLLTPFENLTAAFRIEDVEDYSQYGFDAPVCTIGITAGDTDYEIRLGAYSQMDQQRYADIGDGNVYLLFHDPMMEFDLGIRDVIENDDIPYLDEVDKITFRGLQDYTVVRQPEGGQSYREEDLYFAEKDGSWLPLDTNKVETFLDDLAVTDLSNYKTYVASTEELSQWGLDAPELTIQVDYTKEVDEEEMQDSYTLYLSRNPQEVQEAEEADDGVPASVYARVGDSEIVYEITPSEYETLTACGYNDLRHGEIFPASIEDITALDIALDGSRYSFTTHPSEADEEALVFLFNGTEVDVSPILTSLRSLHAEEFTQELPTERKEISLELTLESGDKVLVELYRKDGTHCIAKVDGEVIALIPRAQAVDLMEQIHTIVLAPVEETTEPAETE